MFAPSHRSRIIEGNKFIFLRNQSGDITTFVTIAKNTCEGQIFRFRITAMFATDDVFNLKPKKRVDLSN